MAPNCLSLRRFQAFEPTHLSDRLLELVVIGFDHIVEIFALFFQSRVCQTIGWGFISVDGQWLLSDLERLAQKALGGLGATCG